MTDPAGSTDSAGGDSGPSHGGLDGLKVLDLSSLYAAPFISTLLADHGADVIKVEPLGGDDYRHFPNRMWPLLARGKRSIALDMRDPANTSTLHQLVRGVDVVVVNMPDSLLLRLQLDWDSLREVNPELIYVIVSGYGLDGPYAGRPANGTLGEAFAGLTHMTGAEDGPPVIASLPLGDAITGLVGAFGVLVACYRRLAFGGPGQVIDVNPPDALLSVLGPVLTSYDEGQIPTRIGSRLPGSALRNVFETSDGRWLAISASTPRHVAELTHLSGHDSESGLDLEHSVRLWIRSTDRDSAMVTLVSQRVPAIPVNNALDLTSDPHIAARGSIMSVNTAEFGEVLTPAPAPRLLGTPALRASRTPDAGEDSDEILRSLGG